MTAMHSPSANRKKRTLPGVLAVAVARLGEERLLALRIERGAAVAHAHVGQQLLHARRGGAGLEQRLRGRLLRGIGVAHLPHLVGGLAVLVEQPPADLHGGHDHHGERGELEDARGFHATAASDSRSAWAKRDRSALECASDRKQAS